MRRLAVALAVLALGLGLTACGPDDISERGEASESPSPSDVVEPTPTPTQPPSDIEMATAALDRYFAILDGALKKHRLSKDLDDVAVDEAYMTAQAMRAMQGTYTGTWTRRLEQPRMVGPATIKIATCTDLTGYLVNGKQLRQAGPDGSPLPTPYAEEYVVLLHEGKWKVASATMPDDWKTPC